MSYDFKRAATGVLAIIAGGVAAGNYRNRKSSKVKEEVQKWTTVPNVHMEEHLPVLKFLSGVLERNKVKTKVLDFEYVGYNVPYIIQEIFGLAMQGICITQMYQDGEDVFSLIQSDGHDSLEILFHCGQWVIYHNRHPIDNGNALVVFHKILSSMQEKN